MVLEFKIDRALGRRQGNLFDLFFPRNFVNLGDVLVEDSVRELPTKLSIRT
jgi:hypothetical protein